MVWMWRFRWASTREFFPWGDDFGGWMILSYFILSTLHLIHNNSKLTWMSFLLSAQWVTFFQRWVTRIICSCLWDWSQCCSQGSAMGTGWKALCGRWDKNLLSLIWERQIKSKSLCKSMKLQGWGISTPGGVQGTNGCGTQCSELVGKVGIGHRLDLMNLEFFSILSGSGVLCPVRAELSTCKILYL